MNNTWPAVHGIVGTSSREEGLELSPGLALGLLPALDGLPPVLPLDELAPLVAPEELDAAPAGAPPLEAPLLPDAPLLPPDPELPLGPHASAAVVDATVSATASRNDKTVIVCFLIRSSLSRSSIGEHECGRGARSNGNATVHAAECGRAFVRSQKRRGIMSGF